MRSSDGGKSADPLTVFQAPEGCCDGGNCEAPGVDRRAFFQAGGWAAAAAALFRPLSAEELQQSPGSAAGASAQQGLDDPSWPTLRQYERHTLERVALPIGGVGTGCLFLAGNGALRDFEIVNRPSKGFTPVVSGGAPFFAIWFDDGQRQEARVLEGPLPVRAYEGSHGSLQPTHNLPRFSEATFRAAWPLGRLTLGHPSLPLSVALKAFSPFVPTDEDASGWPLAVLRYEVTNRSDKPLRVSVAGTLPNFVGMNGWETARDWKGDHQPSGANRNRNRPGEAAPGLAGLFMDSEGVPRGAETWGSLALAALTDTSSSAEISMRTSWTNPQWGGAILDFWDDFRADGKLDAREDSGQAAPIGSVAQLATIPPGATRAFPFVIAWHFPNRYSWNTREEQRSGDALIGNYYTTRFRDAWDVARQAVSALPVLEQRTVAFVADLLQADLPDVVKDAALANASTLVTQTCFRTPDGNFFGWEGTGDSRGCCHGSCTHVWNYEQTTPFLYGRLATSMRDVEFVHATDAQGLMSFRVHLPLTLAQQYGRPAADGQMGCIMKAYRDWQLSGDDAALKRWWPGVRRALEFCWIPGGWDANRDGVMEGAQHNTMDVEYFGPNPQMGFWYLGALRACEEMARHLDENDFARTCRSLYEQGSAWMDANLFNGEYYEHCVEAPSDTSQVAPMLLIGMGSKNLTDPDFQLASGCLVDQLVGQYMAHICGLGYLAKQENVEATLRAILKYNYRETLEDHFNSMRSFALGNERALLMASYPKDRPAKPFPYWSEVMTGFEYSAAVGMLFEGMRAEGLTCIKNIRDRYDGWKRSPFDEAECGHHYARAMAAWAAIVALTDFHYSAVDAKLTITGTVGTHFWSTGYGFGHCAIRQQAGGRRAVLRVREGSLRVQRIALQGIGSTTLPQLRTLGPGESAQFEVRMEA
jgi:non-lysosomal glucosylceramidase